MQQYPGQNDPQPNYSSGQPPQYPTPDYSSGQPPQYPVPDPSGPPQYPVPDPSGPPPPYTVPEYPSGPPLPYPSTQYPGQQPTYPQTQYAGQPPYQPPILPQKRGCSTPVIIVAGVILIVAIIGCSIIAYALVSSPSSSTHLTITATAPANQPTTSTGSTPTTVSQNSNSSTVGQVVKAGNTWQIVVNSIKVSAGGDFDKPDAGNQFILVDVSTTNISGQKQVISSLLDFTLRDSTGQSISQAFVSNAPQAPDGNVAAARTIRGTLAYQAPTTDKSFTLDFADIVSGDQATWNLTI